MQCGETRPERHFEYVFGKIQRSFEQDDKRRVKLARAAIAGNERVERLEQPGVVDWRSDVSAVEISDLISVERGLRTNARERASFDEIGKILVGTVRGSRFGWHPYLSW